MPIRKNGQATDPRGGQALVETTIVMIVTCIFFFGVLQVSRLFAAKDVLHYAAGRGARAKTVGLNDFMVEKVIKVGAIPNAGPMLVPEPEGGPLEQSEAEISRVPHFLWAPSRWMLPGILDYEDWDTVDFTAVGGEAGIMTVRSRQAYPLRMPLHHLFYARDEVEIEGVGDLESHSSLYFYDEGL